MMELTEEKRGQADKLQHSINGAVGVSDCRATACWDCSICLEVASEPVVTLCGHLYCWPRIFRWLTTSTKSRASPSARCPVCKAAVSEDRLVPLYRRATINPAGHVGGGGNVCQVPRCQSVPNVERHLHRLQEPDSDNGGASIFGHHGGNFYYDDAIGMDCSNAECLLGGIALAVLLPWARRAGGGPPPPPLYRYGDDWRRARQQRRVMSRLRQVWLFLAMLVFLCFLLL